MKDEKKPADFFFGGILLVIHWSKYCEWMSFIGKYYMNFVWRPVQLKEIKREEGRNGSGILNLQTWPFFHHIHLSFHRSMPEKITIDLSEPNSKPIGQSFPLRNGCVSIGQVVGTKFSWNGWSYSRERIPFTCHILIVWIRIRREIFRGKRTILRGARGVAS